MSKSDAGKTDTPRPVNREKYERGYIRAFGETCPKCKGSGEMDNWVTPKLCNTFKCTACKGLGRIYDYDLLKELGG